MSKFYAVKKGYQTGIYTDWPTCQNQVKGFSGALYKSFKTRKEAQAYLDMVKVPPKTIQGTVIYTDGSCINKIGGYGIVIVGSNEFYGRVPFYPCTNNIAELYAIKMALEKIKGDLTICPDSMYAMDCLTTGIYKWRENGWKTSEAKDVKNKELIIETWNLIGNRKVEFIHVYGHRMDENNKRADALANMGRQLDI